MAWSYAGERVALGTMHGKEAAIGLTLMSSAGLEVVVPQGLDTDRFGTFTRDVKREGSMVDAGLAKAHAAMTASGCALGLASEGSYGPHPTLPMIAGGHELLVFVDREHGQTVIEQMVTAEVTFAQHVVGSVDDLATFLQAVGFPEQRLVVRAGDDPDGAVGLAKGIADMESLAAAFAEARRLSSTGTVLVETDIRAFANPQRMRTLAVLAARLGERLARPCPHCGAPGFGGDRPIAGRPCAGCGTPTHLPLAVERCCGVCGGTARSPVLPATADPAHCPLCNP